MQAKAGQIKRVLPAFVVTLTALALLLKAFIPAGYMPGSLTSGMTTMVICSGLGEKTVSVPDDRLPSSDQHEAGKDSPCAYHLAGLHKILIAPVWSMPLPAPVALRRDAARLAGPRPAALVFAFAARGPPTLSA